MALEVSTRMVEGVGVVDCVGRIVFGDEATALRTAAKDLLCSQKKIVINLADTSYVDSGGLGALVGLLTSARTAGGTVRLASANKRVIDLLRVTKLLPVFEVFDNVDVAVKSLSKAAVA